jgi:hypothetical protein
VSQCKSAKNIINRHDYFIVDNNSSEVKMYVTNHTKEEEPANEINQTSSGAKEEGNYENFHQHKRQMPHMNL